MESSRKVFSFQCSGRTNHSKESRTRVVIQVEPLEYRLRQILERKHQEPNRQMKEHTEALIMNTNSSTCHPGDGTKSLNRLPKLAESLLRFDFHQELEELRREDSWERETGRSSKTLAKYPDFRIVLVLMKSGTHMNDHKADARISIQALRGKILLHVPDQKSIELSAGQLLALDCGMHHDVEALEESAFLLTVAWRKDTASS